MSETTTSRRVAIVANASDFVGPALARELARRGCDLVLGDPGPDLAAELADLGAESWVVDGVKDLADPTSAIRLLDLAMDAYGRIDAVAFFSGAIVTGPFLASEPEHMERVLTGNLMAPYRALRVFLPPMVEAGAGQVLVYTSATGLRVSPGAPLYSSTRAGANMLVRNVAAEVAPSGVQVNAIGTNFMDFPGFIALAGAEDPAVRARTEATVPMRRLGTMEELAAFSAAFLDGSSGFATGQVVGFDGGWSA
jgi:NAD(P)-dependent dehydrogenase (short-subunit alcohol dehydrogenase family)